MTGVNKSKAEPQTHDAGEQQPSPPLGTQTPEASEPVQIPDNVLSQDGRNRVRVIYKSDKVRRRRQTSEPVWMAQFRDQESGTYRWEVARNPRVPCDTADGVGVCGSHCDCVPSRPRMTIPSDEFDAFGVTSVLRWRRARAGEYLLCGVGGQRKEVGNPILEGCQPNAEPALLGSAGRI